MLTGSAQNRDSRLVSQSVDILHISSARDSQSVGPELSQRRSSRCLLPYYRDQPCLLSTSANLVTPVSQPQALQKEFYIRHCFEKHSRALEACSRHQRAHKNRPVPRKCRTNPTLFWVPHTVRSLACRVSLAAFADSDHTNVCCSWKVDLKIQKELSIS